VGDQASVYERKAGGGKLSKPTSNKKIIWPQSIHL
jgi:hypothetical protein